MQNKIEELNKINDIAGVEASETTDAKKRFPQKIAKRAIKFSAYVASGIAGHSMSSLTGDPTLAAALCGGAWGTILPIADVFTEFVSRKLTNKEVARIRSVNTMASSIIQDRINAGEKPRSDSFFLQTFAGDSDGHEVIDNIFLQCHREPERKKLPHIAAFLANIYFDANINPEYAHQLIKAIEGLSYRQLCLLKIFATKDQYQLRDTDYRAQPNSIPRNVMPWIMCF